MNAAGSERIDPGDDVVGTGGQKLGTVAYVVARPPEMKVTDIVVSTGALLGRDIVVPVDHVSGVADHQVRLDIDQEELKTLPDYVDVDYKEPPAGWIPPAGYLYPAGTMLWPAEMYFPEEASVKVNAPPGTVGVSKGMDVESSDGHKVGSVEGLYLDPQSDDVTALIVKHGFIFTDDTFVPVEYVSGIKDETITLNLTADEVKHRLEGKWPETGGVDSGEERVTGPGEY